MEILRTNTDLSAFYVAFLTNVFTERCDKLLFRTLFKNNKLKIILGTFQQLALEEDSFSSIFRIIGDGCFDYALLKFAEDSDSEIFKLKFELADLEIQKKLLKEKHVIEMRERILKQEYLEQIDAPSCNSDYVECIDHETESYDYVESVDHEDLESYSSEFDPREPIHVSFEGDSYSVRSLYFPTEEQRNLYLSPDSDPININEIKEEIININEIPENFLGRKRSASNGWAIQFELDVSEI
jgi:hypothetical protein